MAKTKSVAKEKWLVFVDTNVLLDFYRVPGVSADRQLKALERHQSLIITSDQIRMEFLKNRQKVIIDSIKNITKPGKSSVPNIVQEYQPAKMLAKHIEKATKSHGDVRAKIEAILSNPSQHDPVFQVLTRIFNFDSEFNLTRPNKMRFTVRNLARKRFVLGYPPRKQGDTSIGDAINWEWIIRCAQSSTENHHVLIVSRDGDYGVTYDNKAVLNDWLRREFKERVSQKRKIDLTNRLTDALKLLDERINPEDESAETRLLTGLHDTLTATDSFTATVYDQDGNDITARPSRLRD
jgi:hypothetical protein